MSPIGDSFPEEFKKHFAENNLVGGSVIRAFVTDTNPPKIKLFVVVGITVDKLSIGTIYLNSEINPNVFQTEDLRRLHIKMEAKGRDYLTHDSFADCSKVYEKDFEEILKVLENDASCLSGQLSSDDFKLIKLTLKTARTISVRVKKKYGLF